MANKDGKRKRDNGEGGLIKIHIKNKNGRRVEASPFWYLVWRVGGRQYKRSSGTAIKQEALAQLRDEIEKARHGFQPTEDPSKLTYDYLRGLFMDHYAEQNHKSLLTNAATGEKYVCGVNHLDDFFGGRKVNTITVDAIDAFKRKLRNAGLANGTINRSLMKLHLMFKLAVDRKKLQVIPQMKLLPEGKPRQGFLEVADYDALYKELPDYVQPLFQVGYCTGMRLAEIRELRWFQVNIAESKITLEAENTKTSAPRVIPMFDGLPELFAKLRAAHPDAARDSHVFIGKLKMPIKNIARAWRGACIRAGVKVKIDGVEVVSHFDADGVYHGLLFHDLRRTAVRTFIRAGVPRSIAMRYSGHASETIFERYNITDEGDLQDGAAQVNEYSRLKRAEAEANAANAANAKNKPGGLRVVKA
jgi:integrase